MCGRQGSERESPPLREDVDLQEKVGLLCARPVRIAGGDSPGAEGAGQLAGGMAEAAGATPDPRGLLDSNRDRAGLPAHRDLGRVASADEVHAALAEDEVVAGDSLGIARTVRHLRVPAGTGEGS